MRGGAGGGWWRSDVGLGVAVWQDEACRDCTRRAAAATLAEVAAEPPSPYSKQPSSEQPPGVAG